MTLPCTYTSFYLWSNIAIYYISIFKITQEWKTDLVLLNFSLPEHLTSKRTLHLGVHQAMSCHLWWVPGENLLNRFQTPDGRIASVRYSVYLLTIHLVITSLDIGGSGGGSDAPPGSNFSHFQAVWAKFWPNNRLVPLTLWFGAPPRLENPGPATARGKLYKW